MIRRPPRSTRTDTLFPYTTLFRSKDVLTGATKLSSILSGSTQHAFFNPDLEVSFITVFYRNLPDNYTLEKKDASNRSEEHTSELQSLMRISYAVFCLKKKQITCFI